MIDHFEGDYAENRELAAENLSYSDIRQKAAWQRKRLEVLGRDDFTCRRCGEKKESLHVHHCYYRKYSDGSWAVPWDYPTSSLITLCDPCHEGEEKRLKRAKDALIHALAECGASSRDYEMLAKAFRNSIFETNLKKALAVLAWSMQLPSRFSKLIETYDLWLVKQVEKKK